MDNGNNDIICNDNNNTEHVSITMPAPQGSLEVSKTASPRSSVEDLSEYQDADESVSSAPTEFLAEFLSAVMMKDYESALKYCKLILQYEPDNATAKEFYPLIVEKIHLMEEEQQRSSSSASSDPSDADERPESDSDATTASYSSLEDDEAEESGAHGGGKTQQHQVDNADVGNGNTITGLGGVLKGLITQVPEMISNTLGTAFPSTGSDSESPTEPVSQPCLSQLRVKPVANKTN